MQNRISRRGRLHQQVRRPRFEVASVKANQSGEFGMPLGTKGRIYRATNAPLRHLIAAAYETPAARVVGGPAWAGTASIDMRFVGGDRFDIATRLPVGAGAGQVTMLRTLLADRFKLTVHEETRAAALYMLVVARNHGRLGAQLRKAPVDCEPNGTAIGGPDGSGAARGERRA